ncbi:MAG TPA: SpoIIE family protein phosphatase [Opitutaceae bacterium]|nr:SpoIIE family protein phosphatase [Opitutaceae bacterium]
MPTGPANAPQTPPPELLDSEILHALMDTIPDRIYFKDLESRFVRVNASHATWLGARSPAEMVGRTDADFFAPAHAQLARETELEIIRTGQPSIRQIERLELKDGTVGWGSATKLPWRDSAGRIIGTFGITRDHTEVRRIEEKLTQERTLLRTIIDHLPSRVFVKDRGGRYILNNRAHQRMIGVESQDAALGHTILDYHNDARGERSMVEDHRVLAGGPAIINRESSDLLNDGTRRWAITTKVPLHDERGKIVGIVGISHEITDRKRMEIELRDRTVEMEADLRMACQIQNVFLTQIHPVFPRGAPVEASALRFAHRYIPAASLGGDFFEIVQLSDTLCVVLVCDVMGHGVRAGLLTALIRGLVGELDERAENPAHVLAEINRGFLPIFRQTGMPVFATVFCGVIDTARQTLAFANAGHPPPLLLASATGKAEPLALPNPEPAAGLIDAFAYTCGSRSFRSGDKLLCYTDGVLEAANLDGEIFGIERIMEVAAARASAPGEALIESVVDSVRGFSSREQFEDDICLLAIESTGRSCPVVALNWEI